MSETNNDEQQFCLRWNNFQANITSQFEALRDDEDFTDVTIACDGKRLQAHRVVLSACSPFFKELFKSNPCSHPIIFMRDVEACHITALMEFMYAGEVNVAQAHLSGFLKTAESLKIRGLTDTNTNERIIKQQQKGETFKTITTNLNDNNSNNDTNKSKLIDNNSNDTNNLLQQQQQQTTTSSQDITDITTAPTIITTTPAPPPPLPPPLLTTSTIITPTTTLTTKQISSPPPKRQCKSDSDLSRLKQIKSIDNTNDNNLMLLNTFNIQHHQQQQQHDNHNQIELNNIKAILQPKLELPDYLSDDDNKELGNIYATPADVTELAGGMEIIPQMSTYSSSSMKETTQDTVQANHTRTRKKRSLNHWSHLSRKNNSRELPDSPINLQEDHDNNRKNRLIKLGEGIEIYEDQLRSVKWNDYRKLTRGLATILFSPAELATCSVTGQRWSRAGNNERPVKPALDRTKVQAIISYVATRFPMVEISRIKQVLAYKCKENSTAFRMKAVRYYEDQQIK